jgi:hypothetical protein
MEREAVESSQVVSVGYDSGPTPGPVSELTGATLRPLSLRKPCAVLP